MKILWFNNIMLPQIAEYIGECSSPTGGWMVKLADELSSNENIQLYICFPHANHVEGKVGTINFCSFSLDLFNTNKTYLYKHIDEFEKIISRISPDVIHVFGTEYVHSYIVSKVCENLNLLKKLVFSIQGMPFFYSKHYYAYLEQRVVNGHTLRDLYSPNVSKGRKIFERLGNLEKETLASTRNIIGRTDWDRACTMILAPEARYYFNDEMLREGFYKSDSWNIKTCEKNRIFMSQATMPLKGLHLALEALIYIKSFYPEIRLYIAGKSYYEKKKWKLSYYEKKMLEFINENNLANNVFFTGFLNEEKMIEQFKYAHIFISPSSIENSPNSVCEAMMMGTPVISSQVGGVINLLKHGEEGFYYQADAPYMLAYYIKKILDDDELAMRFSKNEMKRAKERHNAEKITRDLIRIYQSINEEG